MITQQELQDLLDYNPATGEFRWKIQRGRAIKAGDAAGCIQKSTGYWQISSSGKTYQAHRLAWLYVYGQWPKGMVDHIDGKKTNNAIANLRDVSHRQNQQNRHYHRNGKLVGAGWDKKNMRWQSHIYIDGKQRSLGRFDSELAAHHAYLRALLKLQEKA